MKTHSTQGTLRLGAPVSQARSAVILIHGRGSSAEDIACLADAFARTDVAYVVPSATNGTWYPHRFLVPTTENEPWLTGALDVIGQLVTELNQHGIPSDRIGIAGFSQGACLATEYITRNPQKYLFAAGLSGALIGPLSTARKSVDLRGVSVLLGSAEFDAHIPKAFVEHSANVLTQFGADVTKQIYPGGAHTVFPEEVGWIQARLAK